MKITKIREVKTPTRGTECSAGLDFYVPAGMKVVQLVLTPVSYEGVEVVDEEELFNQATERGKGGFGSTNGDEL